MTSLERWSLHLAALFTGLTGLLYGWLRYYGQRVGDFGVEPHPLQSLLQHLHVISAPLLVFILGMLVRGHVLPMWRSGRAAGRISGVVLALILTPMVLTGYGVQVVTNEHWRLTLAWIHGVSSLLFLAGYAVHLLSPAKVVVTSTLEEEGISLNPS